jgi:hypothetical protein
MSAHSWLSLREEQAMKISKLPNQISPLIGTIMVLAWTLIIGPLGGVLIGAATYFMLVENTVPGIMCVAVLLLPIVLTIIWGCSAGVEALSNRVSDRTVVPNAKRRIVMPS